MVARMSEQQLFIPAILALTGAIVWLARTYLNYLERTVQGYAQREEQWRITLQDHTEASKANYRLMQEQIRLMTEIGTALLKKNGGKG